MKLPKKETRRKKTLVIIAAAALLLIAAGATAWFIWLKPAGTPAANTINYDPPSEVEKKAAEEQKDQIIKDQENPPTNPGLSVIIVRTFQDPSGFNLRTEVGGTTSGECHVQLTKNGQPTVTKIFPVTFEATSASCQNIPITVDEFSTGGSWDLSIIVRKDGTQSAPATVSVTITK